MVIPDLIRNLSLTIKSEEEKTRERFRLGGRNDSTPLRLSGKKQKASNAINITGNIWDQKTKLLTVSLFNHQTIAKLCNLTLLPALVAVKAG
jgi:hypothetical protein